MRTRVVTERSVADGVVTLRKWSLQAWLLSFCLCLHSLTLCSTTTSTVSRISSSISVSKTPSLSRTPSLSGSLSPTASRSLSASLSSSLTPTLSETGTPSASPTPSNIPISRSTGTSSRSFSATPTSSLPVSRSSPTPSASIDTSTPTESKFVSKSTLTATRTKNSFSLTESRHVSRSTATPSCSIGSVSPTTTRFVSKSSNTPTLSVQSLTLSASKHVSRSTLSPSRSIGTWSQTKTKRISRSTLSPSTTIASVTQSNSSSPSSSRPTPSCSSSLTPAPLPTLSSGLSISRTRFRSTVTSSGTLPLTDTRLASATMSHTLSLSRSDTSTNSTQLTPSNTLATSRSMSLAGNSTTDTRSLKATLSAGLTDSRTVAVTASQVLTSSKTPVATDSLSLELLPRGSPCPTVQVSFDPPAADIDDKRVRSLGFVVWFNVTQRLERFAFNAPQLIHASPISTGSQPERMGWLYSGNLSCSLVGGKETIRCVAPPTPQYHLLVAETVLFQMPNIGFEVIECTPASVALAELYIATETPLKVLGARALSAAIGIEGFFASWFGAQSMVYDAHLLALVGQMSCASTLDDYMTMRLMYLVAPMTDYGDAAVVYMNMLIFLVFLSIHFSVAVAVSHRKSIPFNDASELAAFPGMSYACAVAMHAGICYGTFQIALNSESDAMASASIGGFGYMIGMFVGLFYVLRRFAKVSFVEYGFVRTKPLSIRQFLPSGYWDPQQPRRMFGRMLVTVGAGRIMYVPYQMVVVTTFSVITSVRPKTLEGCKILFLVMGCGLCIAASQVAWWRPHRVPVQNAVTTCTMLLLGLQCFLQAPASADHTLDLDDAKSAMWLLQMFVICARGVFDIVIVTFEGFRWGKKRQPLYGVLDEDHFVTENHKLDDDDAFAEVGAFGDAEDDEQFQVMQMRRQSIRAMSLCAIPPPVNFEEPVTTGADDLALQSPRHTAIQGIHMENGSTTDTDSEGSTVLSDDDML